MAAVLQFDCERARTRRRQGQGIHPANMPAATGEVVIFPGVRIERADVDLSQRVARASRGGACGSARSGEGPTGNSS